MDFCGVVGGFLIFEIYVNIKVVNIKFKLR